MEEKIIARYSGLLSQEIYNNLRFTVRIEELEQEVVDLNKKLEKYENEENDTKEEEEINNGK